MKIGRNAPCPCSSGKKYKQCCLRIDEQKVDEERQQNAGEQEIIDTEGSVLDDNEDVRELLRIRLQKMGYEVLLASSDVQALQIFQHSQETGQKIHDV